MWFRLAIVLGMLILIDLYFFQAIKTALHNLSPEKKILVYLFYWLFTALSLAYILSFRALPDVGPWKVFKLYGLSILFVVLICMENST